MCKHIEALIVEALIVFILMYQLRRRIIEILESKSDIDHEWLEKEEEIEEIDIDWIYKEEEFKRYIIWN